VFCLISYLGILPRLLFDCIINVRRGASLAGTRRRQSRRAQGGLGGPAQGRVAQAEGGVAQADRVGPEEDGVGAQGRAVRTGQDSLRVVLRLRETDPGREGNITAAQQPGPLRAREAPRLVDQPDPEHHSAARTPQHNHPQPREEPDFLACLVQQGVRQAADPQPEHQQTHRTRRGLAARPATAQPQLERDQNRRALQRPRQPRTALAAQKQAQKTSGPQAHASAHLTICLRKLAY
jgi:hypothetical protein